ncbi:MAG: hypothetical protein JNK72_24590 [Myxococcales bacterium]|nr:hypothetical protein [Myxococcales bacterium]
MAQRFSGSLTCSDRSSQYKATISRKAGQKTESVWSGYVRTPAILTHAVDAPEAYDDAARAALSFADNEGADIGAYADYTDGGWLISRARPRRNGSGSAKTSRAKRPSAKKPASRQKG